MMPDRLVNSRKTLPFSKPPLVKQEAEGGCGVVGLACNVPLEGKYLLQSLVQMRNRGNGKGGGIAALGLVPEQLGVSQKILDEDYILQVAYLDKSARRQVEDEHVRPFFRVDYESRVEAVDDYRSMRTSSSTRTATGSTFSITRHWARRKHSSFLTART